MSKHQLIYTSCRKGMYGSYDGQNIFSHDKGVAGEEQCQELKKYFGYREPTLYDSTIKMLMPEYGDTALQKLYPEDLVDENGRYLNKLLWERYRQAPSETMFPMHEQIIPHMPHAFIYEKQEDKNQWNFVRLNYLGYDYMGKHGRMGNFLSHVVWLEEEEPEAYPCEYYKSSCFWETIDSALVSREERPDYLPEPHLTVGNTITFQTVADFLHNAVRMDIFKNMVHAFMLSRKDGKPIIICDTEDHVMLWAAAIEYVFPLSFVRDISINSYVYDPERKPADICGVLPCGTAYRYEAVADSAYVFDFVKNECPTFDNSHRFYSFLKTCFTLSRDSLKAFHQFLTTGYTLNEVSEAICDAYTLYEVFARSMKHTDTEQLEQALQFSQAYALPAEKERLLNFFLSDGSLKECSHSLFLLVLSYLSESKMPANAAAYQTLKKYILERFLGCICQKDVSGAALDKFYQESSSAAGSMGMNPYADLFTAYADTFIKSIRQCTAFDKLERLCDITQKALSASGVSLAGDFPETSFGRVYYALTLQAFTLGADKGYELIRHMLSGCDNAVSFVWMTLHMEGAALDCQQERTDYDNNIWMYVFSVLSDDHADDLDAVNQLLLHSGRIEEVYGLYMAGLQHTKKPDEARNLFFRHYGQVIRQHHEYAQTYAQGVFTLYYQRLCACRSEESVPCLRELLQMILKNRDSFAFTDELVTRVSRTITCGKKEDESLVRDIYAYQQKTRGTVDDRIYLLIIGYELQVDARSPSFKWREWAEHIEKTYAGRKAALNRCPPTEEEAYLAWIEPPAVDICGRGCSMARIFALYEMTAYQKRHLLTTCLKDFVKKAKKSDEKMPALARIVLLTLENYLDDDMEQTLCETLRDLNKNKLSLLDEVIHQLNPPKAVLDAWERLKPHLSGNLFSRLFRRK